MFDKSNLHMKDRFSSKKFVTQWWNTLPLTLDEEENFKESYLFAEEFWEELFHFHQNCKRYPINSTLKSKYDFYYDCVLRHVSTNDIAFTYVGANNREDWSYKKLHQCVNFHVEQWSRYEPHPGQLVVITTPIGVHWLVGLMTALRLGLTICYLPFSNQFFGKNEVAKLLSAMSPQFIVADSEVEGGFGNGAVRILIDPTRTDEEEHLPLSFQYASYDISQISLSLYRQEPKVFVQLDANTMYLHALRDSLITFNLNENSIWAAPLSCPIRNQPCSALMSLMAGARWIHVQEGVISDNPQIIINEKIQLLGITKELRQLWSRIACAPTRYLKAFYNFQGGSANQAWHSFAQINKLEKVPSFQVLVDNSLGGTTLQSKPNFEYLKIFSKPSLGISWKLEEIQGNRGFGIVDYQLTCKQNNLVKQNLILTQIETHYFIAGSVHPSREGVTFPLSKLESLVNELSFVEICVLNPLSKIGTVVNKHFILIVFINPLKQSLANDEKQEWSALITEHISINLGTGFQPDLIEFYPMLPKMQANDIDRNWVANQYSKGLLKKKIDSPIYQILNILKKLAADSIKNKQNDTF